MGVKLVTPVRLWGLAALMMRKTMGRPLTLFIAVTSASVLCSFGEVFAADVRAGQSVAPSDYHAPRTNAEKALDAILKLSDREPGSSWVAIAAPWRDKSKDKPFQGLFTEQLRAAWVSAEQKAVKKNCSGEYLDGEMCGIDIHPITCSQDFSENYAYRTLHSSVSAALIEYRWPEHHEPLATYRLVRKGKGWVLDGVSCTGYLKFNMP